MNTEKAASGPSVRIWDRAVRLWHWLIVLAIPAMWLTAEYGLLATHRTIGCILTALVVFRLYWALLGSRTARFSSFVKGPLSIYTYARSLTRPDYNRTIGHSPLGGLSVLALLLALMVQTGTGLFAVDTDGMYSGPLARFVSFSTGRTAAEFHELSFNILLALIALHLAAIVFYFAAKRTNLVRPMVTGRTSGPGDDNQTPGRLPLAAGLVLAGAVAAGLLWI